MAFEFKIDKKVVLINVAETDKASILKKWQINLRMQDMLKIIYRWYFKRRDFQLDCRLMDLV